MAALFALLLGGAAIVLGYVLYEFSEQNFLRETEAAIDAEITRITFHKEEISDAQKIVLINDLSNGAVHPIYLLRDSAGTKMAGNLDAIPAEISRLKEGVLSFTLAKDQTIAAKIYTYHDGTTLLVGRNIHDLLQSYDQFKWLSGLVLSFLLAVVVVSFFISLFVVSRIQRIVNLAEEMMNTGDLSARISIDSNWDDLSHLAQVLNRFLDRVQQLMLAMKGVGDSIAHDLRTPLTRLRNRMEELKALPQTIEPSVVDELIGEVDQMLTTFNALLRISNIEKGQRLNAFQDADLGAIVKDVIDLYEPVAEQKSVVIAHSLKAGLVKKVDKHLVFQMVANVLDNAIKFSPNAGRIVISLSRNDKKAHLMIADEGIGLPAEDKEKAFDRFFRADQSRGAPGNGLGLSLVKAAVEQHQGKVWLEDNHPGLVVHILL